MARKPLGAREAVDVFDLVADQDREVVADSGETAKPSNCLVVGRELVEQAIRGSDALFEDP
jgi:hypothetical protein